jgi:hypothetical protein
MRYNRIPQGLNQGAPVLVSCSVPEERLKVFAFEGVSLLLDVESDPSPDRTSPLDSVANCKMLNGIGRFPLGPTGLSVGRVSSLWLYTTPSLVRR